MKIKRFKRWYQVINNGYTVAQFLTRWEADAFLSGGGDFASLRAGIEIHNTGNRGYTMRRISMYP